MGGQPLMYMEKITKAPSASLVLIDDFSTITVMNDVVFLVDGREVAPVLNRSGYFIFYGLAAGSHEIAVRAKGFREAKEPVAVASGEAPVVHTMRLVPLPSYPFPSGTTLLRGMVFNKKIVLADGTSPPLGDVAVKLRIKGTDRETTTTEKGEFVIYLPRLGDGAIRRIDGKTLVRGDGDVVDLAIKFTKGGYTDGDLFLLQDGNEQKVDKFRMEIGKTARLKKYLTGGG